MADAGRPFARVVRGHEAVVMGDTTGGEGGVVVDVLRGPALHEGLHHHGGSVGDLERQSAGVRVERRDPHAALGGADGELRLVEAHPDRAIGAHRIPTREVFCGGRHGGARNVMVRKCRNGEGCDQPEGCQQADDGTRGRTGRQGTHDRFSEYLRRYVPDQPPKERWMERTARGAGERSRLRV